MHFEPLELPSDLHHFGEGVATPKASWIAAQRDGITNVEEFIWWADKHPEHLLLLSAKFVKTMCMNEMADGNPKGLDVYMAISKMEENRK